MYIHTYIYIYICIYRNRLINTPVARSTKYGQNCPVGYVSAFVASGHRLTDDPFESQMV